MKVRLVGAREEFFCAFDWITNNKFILNRIHVSSSPVLCWVVGWRSLPGGGDQFYIYRSDRQPVGLELQTPIQQLDGGSGGGTGLSTIDSLGILEGSNFEAFV